MINRKILLCFNKYKEKDEIENYFQNIFFSKDRIGAIDFVYDWPSFEKKREAIKSSEYAALVVLCQLTWQDGQGKRDRYSGAVPFLFAKKGYNRQLSRYANYFLIYLRVSFYPTLNNRTK